MSIEFIPHKYQKGMVKFMNKVHKCYLAAEPGLGKTAVSLMRINQIKQKTLVVAPLRIAYGVWPAEIEKWTNFQNIKLTVLHGPDKEKAFLSNRFGVYVINPEGLKWLDQMVIKHKRFPWKVLVIDEAAKFKSHKTIRFKLIKRMLSRFQYIYLLAGNPIPNSYFDLWSQIYILDKGKRLFTGVTRFEQTYFYSPKKSFKLLMFQGAEKEIKKKIKDIVKYVKASDHIDLPEMVMVDVEFDLPSGVVKQYNTMEKKLFSEMEDGKILASNAAVASQKCQQIANGFLYESLTEMQKLKKVKPKSIRLHYEKIELLKDLIEELDGQPILVGYWYKEDLKMLLEAFPNTPFIGGGTTMEEGVKLEKLWNARKLPILFGHIASVSHGLNLQQAGNHVAFYSLLYNYDQYDQFIRRVLRQGNQFGSVIVHRFIAKNTVDNAMKASLNGKGTRALDFLNSLNLYKKKKSKQSK